MPLKTLLKKFTKEPPLGWAQLSHQKIRMIAAVSGIAFADILIFKQLDIDDDGKNSDHQ